MNYILTRWSIPFAGFLLSLMGGISYAWGVFIVPLQERFGWTRAQASLPVSVYLAVFTTVGMIYGGKLQDKYGPRKVSAVGAILFFIGYMMARMIGTIPHLWWLLLTYGVIGGLGCGLTYCAAVPTARKWFPDRVGLAISFAVTGFGLAAAIFAPLITSMIRTIGIEGAFLVLGITTSIVSLFASWLIRNPEPGWSPPGWDATKDAKNGNAIYAPRTEATLAEALRSPIFYFLWFAFVSIIFGGLLSMAHVAPYGRTVLGLTPPQAALAMTFFGLANGFGRPLAGWISEKIGPVKLMLIYYPLSGLTFFLFNTVATTQATLYVAATIFGLGFAVTLGLFPALTTIAFGVKNLGAIYGALITAFGVSSFFGPLIGGHLYDLTGTYVAPFAAAGTLTIVGWLICMFALRMKYKMP